MTLESSIALRVGTLRRGLMEMMLEDVVIVGGGIAGIATSLALKKVGVKSLVLERADELRTTGTAVTLAPNAWRALDAMGVAHKLTSKYRSFTKGYFTDVTTGETNQVSYDDVLTDSQGWSARAVHRRALLEAMAEELPQGTIRLSAKLVSMETKKTLDDKLPITVLHLDDGSIINAKVVIGCDGVHSSVAKWLGLSAPVDSGRSAVLGVSMYPQGHGWKHEVHQFLGEGARAGFNPLDQKQLYWFITYDSSTRKGEVLRDPEMIQSKVMEDYAKGFPSTFLDVVRHSDLDSLTHVPLSFRLPWNLLLGQVCKGNVTVAGDAMHPMTPDLGQGACTALEDAVVLSRNIALSLHPSNGNVMEWEAVHEGLERYVKERRWRVAGVIAGAYIMGRAQQSGSSGWFMKFIRDQIFFRFVYKRILGIVNYDSGKLPAIN